MVIFDRQVVDRVAAKGRTRASGKLLRLVLLPGEVRHRKRRPGPADNARPDPQASGFHPALTLHVQGMLWRTGQRFRFACLAIMQHHIHHRRRMALNRRRHRLGFIFAGSRVTGENLVAYLNLADWLRMAARAC